MTADLDDLVAASRRRLARVGPEEAAALVAAGALLSTPARSNSAAGTGKCRTRW